MMDILWIKIRLEEASIPFLNETFEEGEEMMIGSREVDHEGQSINYILALSVVHYLSN